MLQKNIIIIFLALVLVLGGLYLMQPKYQKISSLAGAVKNQRYELQNKEKYFAELEKISQRLDQERPKLTIIDSILTDNKNVTEAALFNFLQKTTTEMGLTLDSISISGESSHPKILNIQKITFNLSLKGGYAELKNFIAVLYQNAKLFNIESIDFISPGKEGDFSYNLYITTYSN